MCVVLASMRHVCVGEGWAVVTIDGAGGGTSEVVVPFCACVCM